MNPPREGEARDRGVASGTARDMAREVEGDHAAGPHEPYSAPIVALAYTWPATEDLETSRLFESGMICQICKRTRR